jgi:hypothetical protein
MRSHYQAIPQDIQNSINTTTSGQSYPILKRICFKHLRKETRELKNMIRIHRKLRHQSLLSLQEIRKSQGNLTFAEIIRKIIRKELHDQDLTIIKAIKNPKMPNPPSKQEQYQKQWQHINPTLHPPAKSSLNTCEVPHLDSNRQPTTNPDTAATWMTITDPIQIEEHLVARNIAHFRQAQGTLFTTQ